MPEEERKKSTVNRIPDSDRFRYIGFEVFPGKPKDLFKSDEEKSKLVDAVVAKRAKGDVIREHCTLFEERVSTSDRIVLAVACLLILASLFIPWYSVYNEIIEEPPATAVTDMPSDSAMIATTAGDSMLVTTGESPDSTAIMAAATDDESTEALVPTEEQTESGFAVTEGSSSSEETISGYKAKKKIYRQYARLSGIGAFLTLGSVGSYVFSSGFILILTAVILMFYTLLCVVLPIYTLYGIYGAKGNPDQRALKLKKIVRLSWIPVVLFVITLGISFVGAEYGFDATTFYGSLGAGYGIGVFLNSLSWGIYVTLCAFLLIAAKGIEI